VADVYPAGCVSCSTGSVSARPCLDLVSLPARGRGAVVNVVAERRRPMRLA
jgi:hypothetical protein